MGTLPVTVLISDRSQQGEKLKWVKSSTYTNPLKVMFSQFIHAVPCISTSVLWPNKSPGVFYLKIDHALLIWSSTDTGAVSTFRAHWCPRFCFSSCFQFLWVFTCERNRYAKWKKPRVFWSHLYEVCRSDKSIATESKFTAARGRRGEYRNDWRAQVPSWVLSKLGMRWWRCQHSIANTREATGWWASQCWVSCYVLYHK